MTLLPSPLSELDHQIGGPIDLFVCSASFEVRCLSIAENLDPRNVKAAIIAKNIPFADVVDDNFNLLMERFSNKVRPLLVDSNDPVATADAIAAGLARTLTGGAKRVVVDITTFTHENLLMLYKVGTFALRTGDSVEFVYAPASDYSIGDSPDEKWLSKGIREIRSVMGFPGAFVPSQSMHLIVLGGFEDFRALALIHEFEPALVSVGYGDRTEYSTKPHQETNETKVRRLRSLVGDVNEFVFSCYDPLSTEKTLRKVAEFGANHNTVIAPMNTKISTLGAARFAVANEVVQLCYAQPEIYNHRRYSKPGTEFYRYSFDDYPTAKDNRTNDG